MSALLVAWPLVGRSCLCVGTGSALAHRIHQLLDAGAHVLLVSREPEHDPHPRLRLIDRAFEPAQLDGQALAFVAGVAPEEAVAIAEAARAAGVPVNVTDVPRLCDFYMPAVHVDGPLVVAVSTSGQAPGLAGKIRSLLASALPPAAGRAVERFGALRRALREATPGDTTRRIGWLARFGTEHDLDDIAALDDAAIAELVRSYGAKA